LILTLIAAVLQAVSYRKHDEMSGIGFIVSAIATVIAVIAFISSGSNDPVTGG
jgi:hypothetical protein